MLTIPPETLTRFVALMEKRTVPSIQRNFYKKWLRYYLDFCAKYCLSDSSSKSLTQFLAKLREKKQTDEQIKQAAHAVSVYLDMKRPSKTAPASAPAVSEQGYRVRLAYCHLNSNRGQKKVQATFSHPCPSFSTFLISDNI